MFLNEINDDGKLYKIYKIEGERLPEVYYGFAPDDVDALAHFKQSASPSTPPKTATTLGGQMTHDKRGAYQLWLRNGKTFQGLSADVIQDGMTRAEAFKERNRLRDSNKEISVSGPMTYDQKSGTSYSVKDLITPKQQEAMRKLEQAGYKLQSTIGNKGLEKLKDGTVIAHYHKNRWDGRVYTKVKSDGSLETKIREHD